MGPLSFGNKSEIAFLSCQRRKKHYFTLSFPSDHSFDFNRKGNFFEDSEQDKITDRICKLEATNDLKN